MKNSFGEVDIVKEYNDKFRDMLNIMIRSVSNVELCHSISWNFIVQMIPYINAMMLVSENAYHYIDDKSAKEKAFEKMNLCRKNLDRLISEKEKNNNFENGYEEFISHQKKYNDICKNVFEKTRKVKHKSNIAKSYNYTYRQLYEGCMKLCELTLKYDISPNLARQIEKIMLV